MVLYLLFGVLVASIVVIALLVDGGEGYYYTKSKGFSDLDILLKLLLVTCIWPWYVITFLLWLRKGE